MDGREERSGGRRFVVGLALVAAAGLLGRLVILYLARRWQVLGDGYAYHIEAQRLSDGQVPGALHPPAWPFVMAIPPVLGLESVRVQQVMTALIGVATIVVTGLAGRLAFGARAGLVAAALVAVYPNVWLYEREVLSEPLAMLCVAASIWAAFWFRREPGLRRALVLGALVGVSALTRSELIFVSVGVVTPLILATTGVSVRRRVGWLVGAGAVCAVLLAPWAAYNATRYDRPVPLSVGMGPAMRQGNCPPTYAGERMAYYEFGCVLVARDVSTDPSVADGQLRDRALDFMALDRGRSAVVATARVGRVFNVFRPFQQARLETERGSALWVTRSAMVAFWLLVPLAVAGAVIARRRKVLLYPLLVYPLIVLLAVLPTIGAVRYRAPMEIPLVLLAAVALELIATRWSARRVAAPAAAEAPAAATEVPTTGVLTS